jgi:predicted transposase/invertase (TIGR01784 family)
LTVDPREDTLEKLQKNAEPQTKEKIMNAAEKLIQQGKQQGIQQGKQQGIQQGMKTRSLEIAKNMLLNLHLGMDVVQKATGLSSKELKKLQVSE